MGFYYGILLLIALGIAIFAIQNASATPVIMKFLVWRFETSLLYTLLGSMGAGVFLTLFFWIPTAIKKSIRMKALRKEKENLKKSLYKPPSMGTEGSHG